MKCKRLKIENLINVDLDPGSSDESENESDNESNNESDNESNDWFAKS